eukprot:scaffold24512_cov98-Isochrysis_galbana.AAC.2
MGRGFARRPEAPCVREGLKITPLLHRRRRQTTVLETVIWKSTATAPRAKSKSRFVRHVAAVVCRENSRMLSHAVRMRPGRSRLVARGRSPSSSHMSRRSEEE